MWQKFLMICVCGTVFWQGTATASAHVIADPAEHFSAAENSIRADVQTRRIALVIGNADYADGRLANAISDTRAMSDSLSRLGFEVMRRENLNHAQMTAALDEFRQRLAAGGIGLFYFAGHGMRLGGKTLLLSLEADSRFPARLSSQGIDLGALLAGMAGPRPGKLNLVILDTCLNAPFGTGTSRLPTLPAQTLVAYATSPGTFAADGARHGLFTAAWLKALADPTQNIEQMFRQVAATVSAATGQQQIPLLASSLSTEFRFSTASEHASGAPAAVASAMADEEVQTMRSRGILPKDSAEQYELAFWESIKDSTHASDFEAYLQTYPNGRFAALAKARIARLKAAAPKEETPAQQAPAAPAAPAAKTSPAKPRPAPKAATVKTPPSGATQAAPGLSRPAPASASSKPAGTKIRDCPACPELISLPAGTFTMGTKTGDPSEKPAHHVTIGAPFAIASQELSVEQWDACVQAGACERIATDTNAPKNAPMRDVSWDDAQRYVKWLSKQTGKTYRLPTEAEWEYAARGGTSTRYWWGEQMRKGNANCKDCGEPWSQNSPANTGSFAANPYGLYDMNGSVWEWVADCWHNSYKGAPADGSAWEEPNCRVRVIRGGSWREGADYMLSTTRFKYDANVRQAQNGFRVARDLK